MNDTENKVADYFVPARYIVADVMQDHFRLFLGDMDIWYYKIEFPIGQQPDGSVMVPGSERNATE